MLKRYLLGAGIAGALILAYGLVGTADIEQQRDEREQYCEMVELWAKTGGDAGWPPYNGKCEG
jgi:hypothetical protein